MYLGNGVRFVIPGLTKTRVSGTPLEAGALQISAVKPATLGRWLKGVMQRAGIDTEAFSAYSTRGAATSKAKMVGVFLGDIITAANYSSTSTFSRFGAAGI